MTVRCDACGVRLPRQHVAVVLTCAEAPPGTGGEDALTFLCPRCTLTWARSAAQQDALAAAEGRPCGDLARPWCGETG